MSISTHAKNPDGFSTSLSSFSEAGYLIRGLSRKREKRLPGHAFFKSRFSSISSATTSFSTPGSQRRDFTSPDVALRAVSPAKRFLPSNASRVQVPNEAAIERLVGAALLENDHGLEREKRSS